MVSASPSCTVDCNCGVAITIWRRAPTARRRSDGGVGALLSAVVLITVSDLLGWYVWAWITRWVGVKLFSGSATQGQMLRALGLASGPRVFNVLGFVPILGGVVLFITMLWTLFTGV